MNKIRMKLNIFEGDANLIDRTGAEYPLQRVPRKRESVRQELRH